MGGWYFSRVPVNPRLEFGRPLDQVCEQGALHPGLRELFLKAYLNVGEEDHDGLPPVLKALKSGPNGQGLVSERMSLKSKLEMGNWIVATPTPPGTPLWLLRHFLGRLPQPLLKGSHWRKLAIACGTSSRVEAKDHLAEVLSRIVTALKALPLQNYSTLVALVLLVRNLSMEKRTDGTTVLHEEALEGLSRYFIASIITRPYRPGLYTTIDKEHKPLLSFLSEHWPEIRRMCPRRVTSHRRKRREPQSKSINLDGRLTDKSEKTNEKIQSKSIHVENKNSSIQDPEDQFIAEQYLITREKQEEDDEKEDDTKENNNDNETILKIICAPRGVEFGPYIGKDNRKKNDDLQNPENMVPKIKGIDQLEKVDLYIQRIMADENDDNPKMYVKGLIRKYEDDSLCCRSTFEKFSKEEKLQDKRVKTKMNGTQTFECEFLETESCNDFSLIESMNTISSSSITERKIEIGKFKTKNILTSTKQTAIIKGNGATFPLTKTITTLMKILPICANEKETIIILPEADPRITENSTRESISKHRFDDLNVTESSFFGFSSSDVSAKTPKTAILKRNDQNLENYSTISKGNNYSNFEKIQKKSSITDFVTELKSNFKNGWKKPSEARLVKTVKKFDKIDENADQRVFNVQKLTKFLCEKMNNLRDMGSSGSVQELISRGSPDLVSPTNSI